MSDWKETLTYCSSKMNKAKDLLGDAWLSLEGIEELNSTRLEIANTYTDLDMCVRKIKELA